MPAEDQDDDEFAICPYCHHKHHMEAEDYNPGGYTKQCNACKMNFEYSTNYTISHATAGNCELNNIQHDWDTQTMPGLKRCKNCDQVKYNP